jgi:hypothetical protein
MRVSAPLRPAMRPAAVIRVAPRASVDALAGPDGCVRQSSGDDERLGGLHERFRREGKRAMPRPPWSTARTRLCSRG